MTYDSVAGLYDWLETVAAGGSMQRCRRAFLNETMNSKEILLLGEGTGRFLVDLLKCNPESNITYLDSSPRMQLLAKTRLEKCLPDHRNVKFIQADILEKELFQTDLFDLIVTNFFFDCFSPASLEKIVRTITLSAKSKAIWLVSDFNKPAPGIAGLRATLILKSLYIFFGGLTQLEASFLTLPDAALRRNGYIPMKKKQSDWGLFQSTLWLLGEAAVPTR